MILVYSLKYDDDAKKIISNINKDNINFDINIDDWLNDTVKVCAVIISDRKFEDDNVNIYGFILLYERKYIKTKVPIIREHEVFKIYTIYPGNFYKNYKCDIINVELFKYAIICCNINFIIDNRYFKILSILHGLNYIINNNQ